MRVRLWGTRGSLASPGRGHGALRRQHLVRRGARRRRHACWCSTPAPASGRSARARRELRRVDVLLTHLHMDHIQGLGFFAPLLRPGRRGAHLGAGEHDADLRARLTRYLSPPLFPVHLRDLPRLVLHEVPCGRVRHRRVPRPAAPVCHPGSPSAIGSRRATPRWPTSRTTSRRSACASFPAGRRLDFGLRPGRDATC